MSLSLNGRSLATNARSAKVRDDLTARYDRLNKLWERAEAELRSISVPVDAYVKFKEERAYEDPESWEMIRYYLGFRNIGSAWRICVATEHDGWPEERLMWRPIGECTIEERLDASGHFEKLRHSVLDSAEKFVERVDSAVSSLTHALTPS